MNPTPFKPSRVLKIGMELPVGYVRIPFSDMRLVLKRAKEKYAETLYDLLLAIFAGRRHAGLRPESAGRGTVYFSGLTVQEEVMMRPYRHGGLAEKLLGDWFVSPRRFLRELTLTERARAAGVTLLEPIGIAYRKVPWGVKGVWICSRLAGVESLYAYMQKHPPHPKLIEKISQTVAEMHHAGIEHPDLTVQNILLTPVRDGSLAVSIIDFDKAVWRARPDLHRQMKQLRRLDRSLLKWSPPDSPWRHPKVRLRFAAGYIRSFPQIRPLVKEYLRRFERYKKRYRLGWFLQGLLKNPKKRQQ